MILSDRSIREQLAAGRIVIKPLDDDAIQPSSVDVRVGHQFRVFANSRYPFIDVRREMEGLTELVEASEQEPFILHPGEFVLAATLEMVTLPDDLVARLEGKSSLGRLGLLIHSSLPASEPVLFETDGRVRTCPLGEIVAKRLTGSVAAFDPETFAIGYHQVTGWYQGPADRIYEVVLASGRRVRVTGGHNLFTLDRDGALTKVRTGELQAGTRVAIPRRIPDPDRPQARLALVSLVPEHAYRYLVFEGPAVTAAFERGTEDQAELLRGGAHGQVRFQRGDQLPFGLALQIPGFLHTLGADDRVRWRGGRHGLPCFLDVDEDLAWLLGLYSAAGSRRGRYARISHPDPAVLDRARRVLAALGLPVARSPRAITCRSALFTELLDWLGVGSSPWLRRLPADVFGWPRPQLEAFLDGFLAGAGSRQASRLSLMTSSATMVGDLLLLAARLDRRGTASSCNRRFVLEISVPERQPLMATAARLPAAAAPPSSVLQRLDPRVDGDLLWDEVVDVRNTGDVEPVFDLEVRPGGCRVENFLAGHGGVFASNTAGFVDAGFEGNLTLELSNVANLPITIYPGMKIGQLAFFQLDRPAEHPYGSSEAGSKYQGQQGPTSSRYHLNFSDDASNRP